VSLGAAFILLVSLVVSTALLLTVMALIWFFDRYDREPLHLVVAVFLWGASVAPTLSIVGFSVVDGLVAAVHASIPDLMVGSLSAPLLEETAKGIGLILVVLFSRHFDNSTDGLVYGTAVGLGFAVTENFIYALGAGSVPPFDTGNMLVLTGGRTLFSAGVHALSSAIFGGFLGHAILTGRWPMRFFWGSLGFLTAVVMHGTWNAALLVFGPFSADGSLRSWLAAIPVLYLVFGLVLALFLRSEQGILKRELEEEVEFGTAPSWVTGVIPYYRQRVQSYWWPDRRERTVISRLLTRVAFRKHALRRLPSDEATLASLEVVQLRQRVREILDPTPGDESGS
jgi:RsiW-degrading membrane proteinase PrsW (M82 family)